MNPLSWIKKHFEIFYNGRFRRNSHYESRTNTESDATIFGGNIEAD